ncbi:ADP-ribose pyrophosphatase, mitochondrial-like isoform X2 [Apostichopus japonicus]|uniref:ADP-ribose pyrophosphatase, mitochondrial-like isoform X2 n=1 Tax=Stichopus japonicus TaxID=307972 RepID=UPI003AB8A456
MNFARQRNNFNCSCKPVLNTVCGYTDSLTQVGSMTCCVSFTYIPKRLFSGLIYFGHIRHLSEMATTTGVHTKARSSPYPGSTVNRTTVPDDKVDWSAEWKDYSPVEYTAPSVKAGPVWADVDITSENDSKKFKFNLIDGKVNRKSHCSKYTTPGGIPRNPNGRTGMNGRGLLGKWGPNHAADPIVTRWKRDKKGKQILDPTSGKPVLQFVSIMRKDSGVWAIPGGMVDAGERVSVTLKREFGEEALNSIDIPDKERKSTEKEIAALFKHGYEVYRGYVDDPRNTDNAWMETIAVNFHDEKGKSVGKFNLTAGDDAQDAHWADISSDLSLYASHEEFIHITAVHRKAHWDAKS